MQRLVLLSLAFLLFSVCRNPGATREFTATTYNTHYMEKGLEGIIETLIQTNSDIIALQEVLTTNGRPTSIEIARRMGYRHYASQPYVSYGNTQWVLAFVTKLPVAKIDERRLGHSRRALRISVAVDQEIVDLITFHLTPISGSNPSRESVRGRTESRKAEIRELLAWVRPQRKTILLGDFNMLRGTMGLYGMDEYSLLLNASFQDADGGFFPTNADTFPLVDSTRQKIAGTFGKFFLPRAITLDYVFLTDGITVLNTNVLVSSSSDHWPLSAKLRLDE